MTNPKNKVLYTGFTSDLARRVYEHRHKFVSGFTAQYNAIKCIYYEAGEDYEGMLAREKQIKNWNREKKERLINQKNPNWEDLFNEIYD
ncbi:MAG: GIY-YIG nuclease family protein [Patescibacteria group bacterium]